MCITLGPKGMDKMLVDSMGDVIITNDGATILKEMDIEHPAAKMIIEVAKTQEAHCFDGTTSAVVLVGELLKRSEDLIEQNVHPPLLVKGLGLHLSDVLNSLTIIPSRLIRRCYTEGCKNCSNWKERRAVKAFLAEICVNVVLKVATESEGEIMVDLDDVKVEKKQGGSIKDSISCGWNYSRQGTCS